MEHPSGRVLVLRADHLAFFALEKAFEKPLSQILQEYNADSYSAIYGHTWHFLTTWRLENEPDFPFEEFLKALPIGAEWTRFAMVDFPGLIERAIKPVAPTHETKKKRGMSSFGGLVWSLKQLLSDKARSNFGDPPSP